VGQFFDSAVRMVQSRHLVNRLKGAMILWTIKKSEVEEAVELNILWRIESPL
jgi:hypothetical protein